MEIKPILEVKPAQLASFDCGIDVLNIYLKRFAKKNDKLGIGRTFVLLNESFPCGFYTLSMAQILLENLPKNYRNSLPRYPIPVVRLGKLAVDIHAQGKRMGEFLLMDALSRCICVSKDIAVFAVIVNAKNPNAKKFYKKYGFIPFDDEELSLFLQISTLEQV